MMAKISNNIAKLPSALPLRLSKNEKAYNAFRPHFQMLLEKLARQEFIIHPSSHIVLNVLEKCIPELQSVLKERYLGLALGGSLVRGVGTPQSSDIDAFLYVSGIDEKSAREGVEIVRNVLRINGLAPCDDRGYYDLDGQGFTAPKDIVSAFTNYFIRPSADLKLLARQAAERVLKSGKIGKESFEDLLNRAYFDQIYCDEEKLVKKFLQNMAQIYLVYAKEPDVEGVALSYQYPLVDFLVEKAQPYVVKRMQQLPFPRQLASLFEDA